VELNNTFYARPTEAKIRGWLAATPTEFRFSVKAQRGASMRAMAVDAPASVAWLTEAVRPFGERLGTVLFRVPEDIRRDDARLASLLAAWPRDLPLTMEFQDASWHVDEVFAALREAGAVLCATDLDELPEAPTLRLTGPFLYVRLRRGEYTDADISTWASRLIPFLAAANDAYVFFKHDETGVATRYAAALTAAVAQTTA